MRYILMIMCLLLMTKQAHAVVQTGHATVIIKKFIELSETTQMHFGTVQSSGLAGDVTLAPNGTRTSVASTQYSGTATPGTFSVVADPNTTLSVTIGSTTLADLSSNTIVLDTMAYTPAVATTNGSGSLTIHTGGTITLAPNQPSGTYTGTYNVTVDYP